MLDFQSPLQADASALGALAKFYRMIPEVSLPVPADAAAGGTLPLRAYRYCEPIRVASQLGWYVFAPMDFSLMWDGTRVLWRYPDAPDWMPLDAAQFPNYAAQFDADAPDDVKGYSPPFSRLRFATGCRTNLVGTYCKDRRGLVCSGPRTCQSAAHAAHGKL